MEHGIRSLSSEHSFPYKDEIVDALAGGASCRKDDRVLLAKDLIGTYQVRLRIAQDPMINEGTDAKNNVVARDLTTIVANLSLNPEAQIDVFYVRDGERRTYLLFESAQDGAYVGCMCACREDV